VIEEGGACASLVDCVVVACWLYGGCMVVLKVTLAITGVVALARHRLTPGVRRVTGSGGPKAQTNGKDGR
jgi:hypothetical protein